MNDFKFMDNFIIYNISVEYVFFIDDFIFHVFISLKYVFLETFFLYFIRNKENGERVDYRVVDPNNKTR